MNLKPQYNSHQILKNALREEFLRKIILILSRILGFGSLGMYTFFLVVSHYTDDPSFVLFSYFAVFANLSHLVWGKVFEVPQIYENLLHPHLDLQRLSFEVIQAKGQVWTQRLMQDIYGRNPKPPADSFDLKQWQDFLLSLERYNWKKIGIYYGIFYLSVASFVFGFLVYRLVYLGGELSP